MKVLERYALYFTWLVASIGALISLYFSDIRHFEPCHLCWYQRICLFPLVIILGIGAYQGYFKIALYALPLTLLGFSFAIYQVLIQEIPGWNPINICGAGPSCTERIALIGPLTIPMLSALLFATIIALLCLVLLLDKKEKLDS